MQWLGIRLVREVGDFVDDSGKPRTLDGEFADPPDDTSPFGEDELPP